MKSRFTWFITLVIALSMLLSACGGATTPTEAPPPPPAPTATPLPPEPTEVPPEPTAVPVQEATEAQIDAAYQALLDTMVKYNTMSLEELAEKMAEDAKPFLLDVRSPAEAEENGHIEAAVLVPLHEVGANLDKLPSFDTPIVSYCGSGWRCTIAMTGLVALGWQDVLALKGNSYGGWVEGGYPTVDGVPADAPALDAAEPDPSLVLTFEKMFNNIPEGFGVITTEKLATDLVEKEGLVVIDVRTQDEIDDQGYIDGSVSIPLQDFIAKKTDWPADKDTPIAIYCGSGHRSTMAMTMLWTYGYTDVTSLKGGFGAWKESGNAVTGGSAPDVTALLDAGYTQWLSTLVKYNTMSLDELNVLLGEEPPPYLLDVRTVAEAEEKGHIEGAYLVPLIEVGAHYDLLPSFDTSIVSYCGSGWRCTIAMTYLGAMGWQDVKALKGNSYGGWVEAGYPTVAGLPPETEPLNAANPDPALAEHFAAVFAGIPEGYGGISVDDLNLALAENPDVLVIDVRTEAERAENGVIEAANQLAIPLEDFISMKAEWPAAETPVVIYCGSGHRSTIAMSILWSYGYTDVKSMKGGFAAWVDAGYPVAEAVPAN